jgi:uncharacterized damage-inducible protein DinB
MNTKELVRANLSSARKELTETFPHLSDETFDWAPREGMRTLGGQVAEIGSTEYRILLRLQGDQESTMEALDAEFLAIRPLANLLARLEEVRKQTLDHLATLSEEDLLSPAPISKGFSQWLDLEPTPIAEVLRYIARHEAYHTGQIVSYLWARGDNPYDWD